MVDLSKGQSWIILTIAIVAAAWWFAYGAPASAYYRAQNRALAALGQSSTAASHDVQPATASPPLVIAQNSITLGHIGSQLATVDVFCILSSAWPAKLAPSHVELVGTAGDESESLVLDSTEAAGFASAIDTILSAARQCPGHKGSATLSSTVGDLTFHMDIGGPAQPTLILNHRYFFLDGQHQVAQLGQVLGTAWPKCRAESP